MPNRLKDKVALVVGAGSIGPGWGNGKATAVTFAREGAKVFCADVNVAAAQETADLITGEGGTAQAFRADVTNAGDVTAMVEACRAAYGRIDVLDNNVGIALLGGVVEISEADWDRVLAVNLKGAFLTMKHVIPVMIAQGGGSIINISSIAAIRYTGLPYSSYYASKAALSHLTRTSAVEYASQRIRVNAILPGLMQTPMVEHAAGFAAAYAAADLDVAGPRPPGADGLRRRRLRRRLGGGLPRERGKPLRHRPRACGRRRRHTEIRVTSSTSPAGGGRRAAPGGDISARAPFGDMADTLLTTPRI